MAENQNDIDDNKFKISIHANRDYENYIKIWRIMDDCLNGSYAVEHAGMVDNAISTTKAFNPYLPPNKWQREHYDDYLAYLLRAVYFAYATDTLIAQLGMLAQGEATVNIPDKMEYLKERATASGDGLFALQRRLNHDQLGYGRYHMITEVNAKNELYINELPAQKYYIAGMDKGTNFYRFILLDASTSEFNFETKQYEQVEQLQILGLDGNNQYYQQIIPVEEWVSFDLLNPTNPVYPELFQKRLDFIPFTACNVSSINVMEYEMPPLYDLAKITLALFRSSADYYQTLYMGGQETFVISGGKADVSKMKLGAGAVINLENPGMQAQYVGINGIALGAQKLEMDNLHKLCQQKGVSLIDFTGNSSGAALQTIQGAQTASLQIINDTGGNAIQQQLRYAGKWYGLSDKEIDEIKYVPSQDFARNKMATQEFVQLWSAVTQGLPMSYETFHKLMSEAGLTDLSYEDEQMKITDQPSQTAPSSLPFGQGNSTSLQLVNGQ